MMYSEVRADLFSLGSEYMFAHCISSDYAMGAGIAKRFTEIGVKDALFGEYGVPQISADGHTDRWHSVGYCVPVTVRNRIVFNLVTKERYWQKPTYATLTQALENMKQIINEQHDISPVQIAMPKLGCGLDRLRWDSVRQIILSVFDFDVEIKVAYI